MTTDKQRQAQAEFGSITPMGAIHRFGCTKLSTE